MRIAITGSTGFLGRHLVPFLQNLGHEVQPLQRGSYDIEGFDAVINLSGESITNGLWTDAKKERLWKSRVDTAQHLSARHPKIFLSASAIGFYGSQGERVLTEESGQGSGFLAELAADWEKAAVGVRTVHLRTGIVLDPSGGILKKMVPLFKCGLGGKIGNGQMWMSWIALQDFLCAVQFLLEHELSGPFNLTAPNPVTNSQFTKMLGAALKRPTVCRVPAWLLRLLLGQMAEETMLSSIRALPKRLLAAGFQFTAPDLNEKLFLSLLAANNERAE